MTKTARVMLLLMGLTLVSCGPPPATRESGTDSPELQAYIAAVRKSRMTEGARMQLRTVASIITGGSLITFHRDSVSAEYVRGYQSTSCSRPGADSLAAVEWQREVNARIESVMPELRPLADSDQSGFVTDREAWQLRELLEFGYFVRYLTTSERAGVSAVAAATHLAVGEVMDRVEKYNAAAARMPECLGCDVPILVLK